MMGGPRDSVDFDWLNSDRNARSWAAIDGAEAKVTIMGKGKGKKGKGKKKKRSQVSEGSKSQKDFVAARKAEKETEDNDELTQQLRKLKVLQREEELNQLKRFRRLQIDPDHHGDEIPWSHTLGTPIKHMRRDRPVSAGIFRNTLEMDEDEVYRNLLKNDRRAAKALKIHPKMLKNPVNRLYDSSPQRGKIRPKSAHTYIPKSAEFKNVYHPKKVFERSYSGRCIKEKLKNDKSASELIAIEVAAREKWMKNRLLACVDEANVYSRTVNEPYLYRIYLKVADEHTREQEVEKYVDSVRYDQIFVEVINPEQTDPPDSSVALGAINKKPKMQRMKGGSVGSNGVFMEGARIMSGERFFEDHTRLYVEIKKRRSLMARSQAKEERLRDKRSNPTDRPKQSERDALDETAAAAAAAVNVNSVTVDGMFSKEKAYEKMKVILSELIECKRRIETQCKEIRARGWNSFDDDEAFGSDDNNVDGMAHLNNNDNIHAGGDDVWYWL